MDTERLRNWERRHLSGDHADDAWVVDILRRGERVGDEPALFQAATRAQSFQFLQSHGVDLVQTDDDGHSLLFDSMLQYDLPSYEWLCRAFKALGAIDRPIPEGITPLSSCIKFGELMRARLLLENGASVYTVARINEYGGAELDIPTQAVLAMPIGGGDKKTIGIEALKLLQEFGFKASPAQKAHMLTRVGHGKDELRRWIEENI